MDKHFDFDGFQSDRQSKLIIKNFKSITAFTGVWHWLSIKNFPIKYVTGLQKSTMWAQLNYTELCIFSSECGMPFS